MKRPAAFSPPPFRVHKATNQAYIVVNRKRIYLGRHDAPNTAQKYLRTLAELDAHGGNATPPPDFSATVAELLLAFWTHAKIHYRKPDGTPTKTLDEIRRSVKVLSDLYSDTLARDFGPRALKACRMQFVRSGAARSTVNARTAWVKKVFSWGVENELVPGGVCHALDCVTPLERGRTEAPEGQPVRPVIDAHVERIRDHVSAQVWAMIQLQLLTGARPGEIVRLCALDLDRSNPEVWIATLKDHKTAHRGRTRTLFFNETAQGILREFMQDRPLHLPLFSPREAVGARHAKAEGHRRPNQAPPPRITARTVGDAYTVNTFRAAIARACDAVGIPRWAPNRLRHTAGTKARKAGLDVAQLFLGHASANTTEIYAEADHARMLHFVKQHQG